MAWKFIVKDLLLIVSWIGSVITYTTIPDNSSYIFNKLIKNLKFRYKAITLGNKTYFYLHIFISSDLCHYFLLSLEQNFALGY